MIIRKMEKQVRAALTPVKSKILLLTGVRAALTCYAILRIIITHYLKTNDWGKSRCD